MAEATASSFERTTPAWSAWAAAIAGLCLLLAVYGATVAAAVAQWSTSSAYSYGFLIAPIAIYLIWLERPRLALESPAPTFAGLAVIALFGVAWLAADFLNIAEGRQFALVGMIQGLLLGVLGWRIYRILLFPFLYLWLMVPTGSFLLAPLQHLSSVGAVALIKLSGIPVFAEGILIQVPEGHFVVEPGCSGLNFILTALALSLLYGKLNYATASKRVVCVAVALVTAIAANIARIYLIIVLTQLTHRQLDIADDHLLYGWGFFGVIMLAMMWWGGRFADPLASAHQPSATPAAVFVPPVTPLKVMIASVVALVVAAIPATLSAATAPVPAPAVAYALPDAVGPWRKTEDASGWQPSAGEGAALRTGTYVWDKWQADIAVTGYAVQGSGREAASGANTPAAPPWEIMAIRRGTIATGDKTFDVTETLIRNGEAARTVISWYQSGDCITASRLRAKVCAAEARLHGRAAPGAFVALSSIRPDNGAETDSILTELARALLVTHGASVSTSSSPASLAEH